MDLVLIILCTLCIGIYRLYKSGNLIGEEMIIKENGELLVSSSSVPVGNNLMLKREAGAFMKIVKEMGLMK